MNDTIKQDVTIQSGGLIQIWAPQLKPGTRAEVIVIPEQPQQPRKCSLRSLIGAGKGAFATPEEADRFIRAERDAWE